MDDILAAVATLDRVLLETDEEEYDSTALQVLAALRKAPLGDHNLLLQLLDQADPGVLTIPYFFALHLVIKNALSVGKTSRTLPNSVLPEGKLWPYITQALLTFDPIQVRYVAGQLRDIIEIVYSGADQSANFVPALQILRNVILRLDPTSTTLTLTHYQYLRLCLATRAYVDATDILDRPIYHVPTPDSTKTLDRRLGKYRCSTAESSLVTFVSQASLSGKVSSRVYLEYYLLGAMCYIATEQWKKAQAFLEVVLVHPTVGNAVSLIMVEAFKKWLLIGLLIDGKGSSLPRAMSGNAGKSLRALTKPYDCVVDAFKSHKEERLRGEIQEGLEEWNKDGNYGLMREVYSAFSKFEIVRLGKTFAALSVEEIATKTSPTQNAQETLTILKTLIQNGDLHADITPSQKGGLGTVRFLSPGASQKSESEVEKELATKSQELNLLLKYITDYDHQLEVNKDYLEFLLKTKKARDQDKKAANSGSRPIGMPPGPADLDEDMMDDW